MKIALHFGYVEQQNYFTEVTYIAANFFLIFTAIGLFILIQIECRANYACISFSK